MDATETQQEEEEQKPLEDAKCPTPQPSPQLIPIEASQPSEPNLTISSPRREKDPSTEPPPNSTNKNSSSDIVITFRDESISDLYKAKFHKFLENFIELDFFLNDEDDKLSLHVKRDTSINPSEWEVVCEDSVHNISGGLLSEDEESPSKKRKRKTKAKKELFVLDSKPDSVKSYSVNAVRYTPKFTISVEKNLEDASKSPQKASLSCFNCGEAHNMKDCTQPRDFERISAARNKNKSSRYHLEPDQKFSHLKPGQISTELRRALGLHKNDIPHYVYQMRRLGYPPGWLEEAKHLHSDLTMFDIDGNHVRQSAKKIGLDPDKVVTYPGFNTALEKGVKDEHRHYGVPPLSEEFSKEAMINFYNQQMAKEEDNLEACDMEIEEAADSSSRDVAKKDRSSPSLVDLEEQKKILLDALTDAKEPVVTPEHGEIPEETTDVEKVEAVAIKTTCFGTPILKSTSPFVRLPNPEKFSKDVSPVINFENLPNSTGKYEQMTDVLQKVRSTLKKIQNCNS